MTAHVRVLVRIRPEVLDPQGVAVRDTLVALGFGGVRDVRIGKLIELEVDEGTDVAALCRTLLVHDAVEIAEIAQGGGGSVDKEALPLCPPLVDGRSLATFSAARRSRRRSGGTCRSRGRSTSRSRG